MTTIRQKLIDRANTILGSAKVPKVDIDNIAPLLNWIADARNYLQSLGLNEPSKDSKKFCVDCKWHEPAQRNVSLAYRQHSCWHPQLASLVTGEIEKKSCQAMREIDSPCGPFGRLWEAKD